MKEQPRNLLFVDFAFGSERLLQLCLLLDDDSEIFLALRDLVWLRLVVKPSLFCYPILITGHLPLLHDHITNLLYIRV